MTDETKTSLLSKLRAPVADERVSPPLPAAWGSAINDAGDGHVDLYSAEQMQEYARAALASAPVVDEPVPYPKREDVTPEMRASFERLFSEARKHNHGTLARNEQGAYRDLRVDADWVFYQRAWADALASAPVAKPKRAPVDDGICWSSKEIQRRQKEEDEARAAYYLSRTSAPVAGEAQDKIAYEIPTGSGTQRVRYTLNPQTGEFDTIATIIGEAAPVEHIMSLTNLPKEMLRTLTIGGASLPGDPPVETMPTSTAPLASTAAGEAQKPVAWFIDWPDEPELGHYIAESPADSGRNRPLVFADASTQESTPVPEEPVYAYRRKGMDDFVTCNRERFDELSAKPRLFETRIFYAAPQASEAVRIVFPTHLRKMWSGGEVQAWLDEHQGVIAPKASAKGSLERYRKWQAERDEAFGAGVKAAADLVKKMVDGYDNDHGSTDPETGWREYPGEGGTWVCEMQELEESIRALSSQPSGNPGELAAQPGARRTGGSDAN